MDIPICVIVSKYVQFPRSTKNALHFTKTSITLMHQNDGSQNLEKIIYFYPSIVHFQFYLKFINNNNNVC